MRLYASCLLIALVLTPAVSVSFYDLPYPHYWSDGHGFWWGCRIQPLAVYPDANYLISFEKPRSVSDFSVGTSHEVPYEWWRPLSGYFYWNGPFHWFGPMIRFYGDSGYEEGINDDLPAQPRWNGGGGSEIGFTWSPDTQFDLTGIEFHSTDPGVDALIRVRAMTSPTSTPGDTLRQCAPIRATIDIAPDTLNLKRNARWIVAYIGLPDGYDVNDIDTNSVILQGLLPAAWGEVQDDVLMVKFDWRESEDLVLPGKFTLAVNGKLTDGMSFIGLGMVTVIDP